MLLYLIIIVLIDGNGHVCKYQTIKAIEWS